MDKKNITQLCPLRARKECTRPDVYATESGFSVLDGRLTRFRWYCWHRLTRQGSIVLGSAMGRQSLGPAGERERLEASCSYEEQRNICSQKIRLCAHRKKCIKGREHLQRTERTLTFLFLIVKNSWQEGIGIGILLKSTAGAGNTKKELSPSSF